MDSVPGNVACTHCFVFYSISWSTQVGISKDHLEYFVKYELTCPDIAEALGVSASTI